MSAFRERIVCLVGSIVLTVAVVSCGPAHHAHVQSESPAPRQFACQSCYDEAVKVRTGPPRHRYYKTIIKHHCSECRADMEVYDEAGKRMIKCGSCAPGGQPCDECLPPPDTKK